MKGFLAAVTLLLVPAIAAAGWQLADATTVYKSKSVGYMLAIPAGWRYLTSGTGITASRDGPQLNMIAVEVRKNKKAFAAIKKTASASSALDELAENYLADLQSAGGREIELLSNEPTLLGGRPAFRLQFRYRATVDEGAVRYGAIVVGLATEKYLLLVHYRAPLLHYYPLGVADFERTLETFSFDVPPVQH
jgi:hypothetical protein